MSSPRVVVLVLNYNGGATLEECLRSLQETTYPNTRLVVLDNGSTDGSAEIAQRMGIETRLYGENLGYCAAYNRAFREFSDDVPYLLLSNADLVASPETIEHLVASATRDERIGFVGPVQRHADTREIRSAGVRWTCGRLPRHITTPGEPFDYLEGAFLLVRGGVLDEVGDLDENLALNMEDLDWQTRASQAGFHSVLVEEAVLYHHRPSARRITTGAYYQTRNACIVTERYCGRRALIRLKARLYAEGVLSHLLGRSRGDYILEGLRDFRRRVTGLKPPAWAEPRRGPR